MKSKKFWKKYWVNLSWFKDGYKDQSLYESKEEAQAILPPGDELAQIEVREL